MKLRTILLGLAALFVAFNAAFFSITGLSQLFAGASLSIIIMASSLELAKLISASFLYNYWKRINKVFRFYLLAAIVILILITSAGIYGFLTSAFQSTSDQLNLLDSQIEVLNLKKNRFETQLNTYVVEKGQITESINELSRGLSNNVIQYRDTITNTIITTTSINTRRVLERQLNDAKTQRDLLSIKIETLSDSATKMDMKILDLKSNTELTSDLGPLRYLSKITGKPMDIVINWFALCIIFVFDPLAVILIISFNISLRVDREEHDKRKNSQENSPNEEPEVVAGTIESIKKPKRIIFEKLRKKLKKTDVSHQKTQFQPVIPTTKDNLEKVDVNKSDVIDDSETPYYMKPDFQWDDIKLWLGDRFAENYWIRTRRGSYDEVVELRKLKNN